MHSRLSLVSVLVLVVSFTLSACGNAGGAESSSGAPANDGSSTDAPTSGNQPGAPPVTEPSKFQTHLFSDGHYLIFDRLSQEAVLVPVELKAKIPIVMFSANYGFLGEGKTTFEKCDSLRKTSVRMQKAYLNSIADGRPERTQSLKETLHSIVQMGEFSIGVVELRLDLETDAYASDYLKQNWPSEFPKPSAIRALNRSDLSYDVTNSYASVSLTAMQKNFSGDDIVRISRERSQPTINLYCDVLLGSIRISLVDDMAGISKMVNVTGGN